MNYFIDTNIIIDLLGHNKSKDNKKEAQKEAIKELKKLILEDSNELFINRLIVLETLRTIHFNHNKVFREAEEKLKLFRQVDIRPKIYDDAIAFSRFCHSKGIKLKGKCEAIDFLHFITAKYYDLIIISNDGDLEKLEEAYRGFIDV